MKPVDILKSARSMIARPERWCKGHGGRQGDTVCALVAIGDASGNFGFSYEHAKQHFKNAINRDFIANWNDAPERTHPDVLAAFDRAIALAEKEAQS